MVRSVSWLSKFLAAVLNARYFSRIAAPSRVILVLFILLSRIGNRRRRTDYSGCCDWLECGRLTANALDLTWHVGEIHIRAHPRRCPGQTAPRQAESRAAGRRADWVCGRRTLWRHSMDMNSLARRLRWFEESRRVYFADGTSREICGHAALGYQG